MIGRFAQPESVNVLLNNANWDWPDAVAKIFRPSGINALVAHNPAETVKLVTTNKIHLAIIDVSSESVTSTRRTKPMTTEQVLNALRSIRTHDKLVPFILIADRVDDRMLAQALSLGAFSVIGKPVDINVLTQQIRRLFTKWYGLHLEHKKEIS